MKTIYLILFNVLSISIVNAQPKNLINSQVLQVLEEINIARSNPTTYGINNHLELCRLDTVESKEPLKIDYNLCKKAHSYATYLSEAKYNSQKVSCSHSELGLNESINFCVELKDCVSKLILDKSSFAKGHRQHLLSMNNKDTKIGIGIGYIISLDWYVIVIVTEE